MLIEVLRHINTQIVCPGDIFVFTAHDVPTGQ